MVFCHRKVTKAVIFMLASFVTRLGSMLKGTRP